MKQRMKPDTNNFFEKDGILYEYYYKITSDDKWLTYIRRFGSNDKWVRKYNNEYGYGYMNIKVAKLKYPQYFI